MAKEQVVQEKGKKDKKVPVVKDEAKNGNSAAPAKKIKEKKVLKKIEDFNKFTRLRVVKEARVKKTLSEKVDVESTQILKAVKCIQSFVKQKKESSKLLLEDEDEFVYLEITMSKLPEEYSIRPYQM